MAKNEGKAKEAGGSGAGADALTPPTMQPFAAPQGEQTMKYTPSDQNTIQQVQNTMPAAPRTMPAAPKTMQQHGSGAPQSAPGSFSSKSQTHGSEVGAASLPTGITLQDLSGEKLLGAAPRTESHGQMCPTLNGIPMLAKIGQGGMGAVYFGIHPRLRSEVAVKVLPFHLAEQDPGMIRRFYREAQIAAQVRSPHLVNVIDVNEEAGLFFLVMEYVSGCSAGQHLKAVLEKGQQGLPERDALDVIIAATEGLWAAHANGVIHRDIKPDNIMVPYQTRSSKELDLKRGKLMDLGLARSEESQQQSLTGAQAAMGTPGYMAPEQAMDAKTADKRSDVFSMGATLYSLLCGRAPFKSETVMKTLMATMHEPHEPIIKVRPDVSPIVNDVLEKCLTKKQDNRFGDAKQLLGALEDCRRIVSGEGGPGALSGKTFLYGGASTSTAAPASGTNLDKTMITGPGGVAAPAAKSKGMMYVAAGVAVLLLGGGGAFLALRPPPKDPGGGNGASDKGSGKTVVEAPDKKGGGEPAKKVPEVDPATRTRLAKYHKKYTDEALASAKAGDIAEAEFALQMARDLGISSFPEVKASENEVLAAIANFNKGKEFTKLLREVDNLISKGSQADLQTAQKKIGALLRAAPDEKAAADAEARQKLVADELGKAVKKDSARKLLDEAAGLLKDRPDEALEKVADVLKKFPDAKDQLNKDALELQGRLNAVLADKKKTEKYNSLLKEIEDAFNSSKYSLANEKATEAALLIPTRPENDTWGSKIRPKLNEEEQKLAAAERQRQTEKKFNEAMASGDNLLKQGKIDEAEVAAKSALDHFPNNAAALDLQKRVSEAQKNRQAADEIRRKNAEFEQGLAAIKEILDDPEGKPDDAAQMLAEATKVFPDDTDKDRLAKIATADGKIKERREILKAKVEYEGLLTQAKEARRNKTLKSLEDAKTLIEKALASKARDARAETIKKQIGDDITEQKRIIAEASQQAEKTSQQYNQHVADAEGYEKAGDALKPDDFDGRLSKYNLALQELGKAKNLKADGAATEKLAKLTSRLDALKTARQKFQEEQQRQAATRQKFDAKIAEADAAALKGDFATADKALADARAILPDDAKIAAKKTKYKEADDEIRAAYKFATDLSLKPDTLDTAILELGAAAKKHQNTGLPGVLDTLNKVKKLKADAQTAVANADRALDSNKKKERTPQYATVADTRDRLRTMASATLVDLAKGGFRNLAPLTTLEQSQQAAVAQLSNLIRDLERAKDSSSSSSGGNVGDAPPDDGPPKRTKPPEKKVEPKKKSSGANLGDAPPD